MKKFHTFSIVSFILSILIVVMMKTGAFGGLALAVIFTVIIILGNVKHTIYLYFLFISFSGLLIAVYPNPLITYIDECLLLVISSSLALHLLMRKFNSADTTQISTLFVILLLLTLASWLLNRPSPIQLVHFVITYLSFIPFFYAGIHLRNTLKSTGPLRWLVYLLPIHLLLNLSWIFGFNPLPNNKWLILDRSLGTFYENQMLGYCMMFMSLFIISYWVNHKKINHAFAFFCVSALVLFQYILTFVIHSIPLLFFLLATGFFVFWKKSIKKFAILFSYLAPCVVVIIIVIFIFNIDIYNYVLNDLSLRRFSEGLERFRFSPKGIVYADVFFTAPRSFLQNILGFGPGNFASAVGIQYESFYTEKYIAYLYDTYEGMQLRQSTSFIENPQSGLSGIFSELGLAGGGLYFAIHIFVIHHFMILTKFKLYKSMADIAMAQGLVLVLLGYLLLTIFWDMFTYDFFRSGIWFWAGLLWCYERSPQDSSQVTSTTNPTSRRPSNRAFISSTK